MPTLLSRKKDETQLQQQAAPCNFEDPTQNVLVAEEVPLEELKARCARYREFLATLQPPQEQTMVQAANFTVESVQRLLAQSPGSAFIRVYYGINTSGEHGFFMGAVPEATDQQLQESSLTSTASTGESLYVEDCCACPPRLNCPADELLGQQP